MLENRVNAPVADSSSSEEKPDPIRRLNRGHFFLSIPTRTAIEEVAGQKPAKTAIGNLAMLVMRGRKLEFIASWGQTSVWTEHLVSVTVKVLC